MAQLAATAAKQPALGTAGTPSADVLTVQAASVATATRTSVAGAAADTALLAANPARIGATIYNESTAILYLGYGATAVSLTNYSVQVPASGYLEIPPQFVACAIRGYWAAANGSARITVG